MKQTAVHEFALALMRAKAIKSSLTNAFIKAHSDALKMEKMQIVEAYNEGQNTPYEYSESNDVNWYDGNNYYKETFKSE